MGSAGNLDTDEELIASTARPQRSRWFKRAGIASLVGTMLLLSFATGRATVGGSTTPAALKHGVTQEQEVTKIRKPALKGQCTKPNGMRSDTKCCAETNYYCWQQ